MPIGFEAAALISCRPRAADAAAMQCNLRCAWCTVQGARCALCRVLSPSARYQYSHLVRVGIRPSPTKVSNRCPPSLPTL